MKICGLVCIFDILCIVGAVINLNEKNFDHDTQIGTGDTTGPWFILFYDSKYKSYDELSHVFDQVSQRHDNEINFGKLDINYNKNLADRFEINKLPSLVFFRREGYYKYFGSKTIDDFDSFLVHRYKELSPQKINPPLDIITKVAKNLANLIKETKFVQSNHPYGAIGAFILGSTFIFMSATSIILSFRLYKFFATETKQKNP